MSSYLRLTQHSWRCKKFLPSLIKNKTSYFQWALQEVSDLRENKLSHLVFFERDQYRNFANLSIVYMFLVVSEITGQQEVCFY